jgi:hypothetical protein
LEDISVDETIEEEAVTVLTGLLCFVTEDDEGTGIHRQHEGPTWNQLSLVKTGEQVNKYYHISVPLEPILFFA